MTAPLVLTVVANDEPGIVESISQVLADHGGNWTESSMMHLAGQFAGILLVHVPRENVDDCRKALDALSEQGIQVKSQAAGTTGGDTDPKEFTMELVGQDRPGIVRDITEILARHGVNVHELETTVQSASMSGELLFMAHARLQLPPNADEDQLQDDLELLANELMVDISLQQ